MGDMRNVDPKLTPTHLYKMHPTQITVGMHEVHDKVDELKKTLKKDKGSEWLGSHQVPGVIGPKGVFYLIDHHHLGLALILCKQTHVLTRVEADLSHLDIDHFWSVLDARGWVHPYDETGKCRKFSKIKKTLNDLVDDPFRSLAGAVRNAGGYAKTEAPFSEFQWADYFRRIPGFTNPDHWGDWVAMGYYFARDKKASYLPGFCEGGQPKINHVLEQAIS
jgi:hypothetical protein